MSTYNYELVSVFERCNVICVCMFKYIFNRIKHVNWCIHYVFWCIVCPVISWTLARWNIIQFPDGCSKEEVVNKMEHPNIIRVQAPLSKMRRGIIGVMKVSDIHGLYSLSGNSIAVKFERHLGSAAAEVPLKFQSDWKFINPNLAASGDLAVRRLTAWRMETQILDLNTSICVQKLWSLHNENNCNFGWTILYIDYHRMVYILQHYGWRRAALWVTVKRFTCREGGNTIEDVSAKSDDLTLTESIRHDHLGEMPVSEIDFVLRRIKERARSKDMSLKILSLLQYLCSLHQHFG